MFAHLLLICVIGFLIVVSGFLTYLVSNGAGIGTLLLGITALYTSFSWIHNTKANKKINVIDDLLVAGHQYFYSLQAPLEKFQIIQAQIESYNKFANLRPDKTNDPALIQYLKECGKKDGEDLTKALINANTAAANIGFLSNKAKVYCFNNHKELFDTCAIFTSVVPLLNIVATGLSTYNPMHSNEVVMEFMSELEATKYEDLKVKLESNFPKIINLTQEAYNQAFHVSLLQSIRNWYASLQIDTIECKEDN